MNLEANLSPNPTGAYVPRTFWPQGYDEILRETYKKQVNMGWLIVAFQSFCKFQIYPEFFHTKKVVDLSRVSGMFTGRSGPETASCIGLG